MHSEITWLMSLVLDDEATAEEVATLRTHLRTCDSCAATWQRWHELDRRFDAAPLIAAPPGLAAAINARIDEAMVVRQRRRHFMFWFGSMWFAAALLSAVVVLLALNWPLALPGTVVAMLSGFGSATGWLFRTVWAVVASAGAPAVAAGAGALLCLTCGLAMAWLWIINRGNSSGRGAFVAA